MTDLTTMSNEDLLSLAGDPLSQGTSLQSMSNEDLLALSEPDVTQSLRDISNEELLNSLYEPPSPETSIVDTAIDYGKSYLETQAGLFEGLGHVAFGAVKFPIAMVRGASELVQEFAESGTISEKGLSQAGKVAQDVMGFGETEPIFESGKKVKEAASYPFEKFNEMSKPVLKEALEFYGFQGTPEELDNAAQYLSDIWLLPLTGGIGKIAKGARGALTKAKPVKGTALGGDIKALVDDLNAREFEPKEIKGDGGGDTIRIKHYSREEYRKDISNPISFFDEKLEHRGGDANTPFRETSVGFIDEAKVLVAVDIPISKVYEAGKGILPKLDRLINLSPDFKNDTRFPKKDWLPTDIKIDRMLRENGYEGFKYPSDNQFGNEVVILDRRTLDKYSPKTEVIVPTEAPERAVVEERLSTGEEVPIETLPREIAPEELQREGELIEIEKRVTESIDTAADDIGRIKPTDVGKDPNLVDPARLPSKQEAIFMDEVINESLDFRSNPTVPVHEIGFLEDALKSESGLLDLEKFSGKENLKESMVFEEIRRRRAGIDISSLLSQKLINDIKLETSTKLSPQEKSLISVDLRRIREDLKNGRITKETFKRNRDAIESRRDRGKSEREAVSLLIQGIRDHKVLEQIGKGHLASLIKNPTKGMIKAKKLAQEHFKKAHDFLKDNWGEDVGYLENYVTQIWDIPKNRRGEAAVGFTTNNPFTQSRKLASFEEGIKAGFVPKTLDIAEIIAHYDSYRIQAAFNKKFVDAIQNLKYVDENTGEIASLAMRADKAPADWVTIDHPALTRAKAIAQDPKTKAVILKDSAVKVHPDIAKAVKNIFDKPFSHPFFTAIDTINAFAKKGELSVSFFHHWALLESSASSGSLGKPFALAFNPSKIIRELKSGNYEVFQKLDIAKDGLQHGLTLGDLMDIQRGLIEQQFKNLEYETRNIPGVRKVTKGLRKANEVWDSALWDYYHNTLKLNAYETQVFTELKARPNLTAIEVTKLKRDIAQFVNDSFGGQNWDLSKTFGSAKTRQLMRIFLLSPDWTLSTLRQAKAVPSGFVEFLRTGQSVQGKRAALFWIRAAVYFHIISQSVNYAVAGRSTYENEPGKELDIAIGKNKDGTNRYLRMGKQFREVMEWVEDPVGKLGAKMSPALRETMRQFTSADPGSGFPAPWRNETFWQSLPKRVASLLILPIPFSLRSHLTDSPSNVFFAFPTSKGMSNWKAKVLFRAALKREDEEEVERIRNFALENNLDAANLLKSSRSANKAEITKDNKTIAREINKDTQQFDTPQQQDDYYKYLVDKGIMTIGVQKELRKIQTKNRRIESQKLRELRR